MFDKAAQESLLDAFPFGVVVYHAPNEDPGDMRMIYANRQASLESGFELSAFVGKTMRENFPDALNLPDEDNIALRWHRVAVRGQQEVLEQFHAKDAHHEDQFFRITFVPFGDRLAAAIYENITERVELGARLDAIAAENKGSGEFEQASSSLLGELALLRRAEKQLKKTLERKRKSEAKLRESEEKLYESLQWWLALVEHAPCFVMVLSKDLRVEFANDRLKGRIPMEPEGHNVLDLVPPISRELGLAELTAVRETRKARRYEILGAPIDGVPSCYDCTAVPIIVDGEVAALILISRDVTEEKRAQEEKKALEQQLFLAQKSETVGRLTRGIAHDFNNLLTPILGCADLIQERVEEGSETWMDASTIEMAARRAGELTTRLLSFVRQHRQAFERVDVHALIEEEIGLLKRTVSKQIVFRKVFHPTRVHTQGDPGELRQVLMNLALNSCEAMEENGTLTFETGVVTLGEEDVSASTGAMLSPGEMLCLKVSDTGAGIPPEHLQRIFEPFFSSRGELGSGLGLAVVQRIIQSHEGGIRVTSEEGKGTTIELFLPLAQGEQEPAAESHGDLQEASEEDTKAYILVIDDEPNVARTMVKIFERFGYQSRSFCDPHKALAFFGEHFAEVDLVMLDFMMPQMSGHACLQSLRKIHPGVRVLLSSGYALDDLEPSLKDEGVLDFIYKPFRIGELAAAVESALSRKKPS